ncbi:MAG: type II toxin-antitoxin system VapC family toxin [Oscillatoria sp. PMC 1068.18]|nr:type II toxin-antitoxin system VapC family toxin [Oscillatoria sp. PMC 1076.18]MEC4990943.1 type II toxin-antitoxin system VapC family toxin [Oscillatoria sp. PMC 1068.18]
MRILLDTHAFIWYVTDNSRLSDSGRTIIDNGDNEILLSVVSIWEMAIKQSIGKLSFGLPLRAFVEHQFSINKIKLLNINLEQIEVIATLPLHHRDPFDRLLIAQGIVENLPILSRDVAFDAYPVNRLW